MNSRGIKEEIKKIAFRKNLKNHIKVLLFKKKKIMFPLFDNTHSKYIDSLNNKKMNSEILLMKSKFDYYLDKLKNKNIFMRDYKNINNNSNNNINNKNNNEIKNFSLPDIFNSYKLKHEEKKNKIHILKKDKLLLSTKNKVFNLKYNISYTTLNKFRNKSLCNIFNKTKLMDKSK